MRPNSNFSFYMLMIFCLQIVILDLHGTSDFCRDFEMTDHYRDSLMVYLVCLRNNTYIKIFRYLICTTVYVVKLQSLNVIKFLNLNVLGIRK